MGPDSKDRLADVLGHILTELRMQRATQAKIAAKLQIEIEDRVEGDDALGKQVVEHHGILGKLHLIPSPR
jgi:hypothetical protein